MSLKCLLDGHGRSAIPFVDPMNPDRPVTLNTYRPLGHKPENPVVFVQHGMYRNGDEYRDFWIAAADRHGFLVVAPTFPNAHFPETEHYNNGLVFDDEGRVRPYDAWVFATPARIVAELRRSGVMAREKARIYGHSAGAQFVHRMISTHGGDCFEAAVAANAGWYSLPTLDKPFPEGLGGLGFGEKELRRLFAYPLHILAGLNDCESNAPNLPSQPEALAQGPARLDRARYYFDFGKQAAASLGVPFLWRFTEVPNVAHDGNAMSQATAGLWFEGRIPSGLGTAAEAAA